MKKKAAVLVVLVLASGLGQMATAQENYGNVGFSTGGINAWAGVSGSNGYGQMQFGQAGPLLNSFVSSQYGSASMYVAPWANGVVQSGTGGWGNVSASFMGRGESSFQFSKKMGGGNTSVSVSKSVSFSANSFGKGSASISGGFDFSSGANVFVPPVPASTPPMNDGKG